MVGDVGGTHAPPPHAPTGAAITLRARIIVQTLIQLGGRAGSGLGGIVLLALLTRYLGPAGFGRYTFVTGYVGLFAIATDLGSQTIAIRQIARFPERAPSIAGQLFSLKLVLAALTVIAAVAVALVAPVTPFTLGGMPGAVLFSAVALLVIPLSSTGSAIFQTSLRMAIPAAADVVYRVISLTLVAILAAGFLFGGRTPVAFRLDAVLLASTIGLLVSAIVIYQGATRLVAIVPRWDRNLALVMIRDAAPLALVSVLGIIHYRIDVLILSQMRSMSTVGLYGVATKVLDVSIAVAALFMGLVFPVLSRRVAGDRALLQRAFGKTVDILLIAGLGAAVFLAILAPLAVRILTHRDFQGAVAPVSIIAWAIPITFLATAFTQMVVAANKQLSAVPLAIAAILLNVVLNLILIPRMGASGPALATDISESLNTVGMAVIMFRHYGFGPSPDGLVKIAIAAAIAGTALVYGRPLGAAFAIPLAIIVYLVGLALFRVVTPADVRVLLQRDG